LKTLCGKVGERRGEETWEKRREKKGFPVQLIRNCCKKEKKKRKSFRRKKKSTGGKGAAQNPGVPVALGGGKKNRGESANGAGFAVEGKKKKGSGGKEEEGEGGSAW